MLPVLYSFRRCPYAIRARMALAYAKINYEVREVVLRDKPPAMLELSAKGTVPVMLLGDVTLDESIDIFHWALDQHDPAGWRDYEQATLDEMSVLVESCESDFKPRLDRYKYADRHPQHSQASYRQACELFLQSLERRLTRQAEADRYLFGARLSYADVALFPFIRQCAYVDKAWFDGAPYPCLQRWLQNLLDSELFVSVMMKRPQWHEGDAVVLAH
jgi:glutathione S-transferase